MTTEYEFVVKEFLPALRASAAKRMATEYSMSQMGIANVLNMTQAAVSKYLSGKYSVRVKKTEHRFKRGEVDEFVKHAIAESRHEAQKTVCRMCARNLSFKCALMVK